MTLCIRVHLSKLQQMGIASIQWHNWGNKPQSIYTLLRLYKRLFFSLKIPSSSYYRAKNIILVLDVLDSTLQAVDDILKSSR